MNDETKKKPWKIAAFKVLRGKVPVETKHYPFWSLLPGSNRRPHPYHGCALPTELKRHLWSGWRESNPHDQLGKLEFYHWTTSALYNARHIIARRVTPVKYAKVSFWLRILWVLWRGWEIRIFVLSQRNNEDLMVCKVLLFWFCEWRRSVVSRS